MHHAVMRKVDSTTTSYSGFILKEGDLLSTIWGKKHAVQPPLSSGGDSRLRLANGEASPSSLECHHSVTGTQHLL